MSRDDALDHARYLQGDRVRLRPLRIDDAALFQPWINDPEVQRLLGGRGWQFSLPAQEDYVRARLANDWEHGFALAIEAMDIHGGPRLIGNLELRKLEAVERRGEIGIMIGDRAFWGRGYGEDAMRTICRYGCHDLDLHRLELTVAAFNLRALRCYEKVGFTIEGRLRDHRYVSGRYYDSLLMGLLRDDFDAREAART